MRLDVYLCEKLNVESRSKAANLIKMGKVKVNGEVVTKSGYEVSDKMIELLSDMQFASMGGYKLEKALQEFSFSVSGLVCADIGASNGGFTDCLLSHDAKKIFAVDVGECAFAEQLKNDSRVVVIDKFNARDLKCDTFKELVDLIVIDVSFISLKLILNSVINVLKPSGEIIALVKPQFEVGRKFLSKKGIVIDDKARNQALKEVVDYASSVGLKLKNTTTAPIRDGKNIEFLINLQLHDTNKL